MYKVKATVIDFLGDTEKYPCHFEYKIGDEVIFDGEKCIGRVCRDLWTILIPKAVALMIAGPKYRDPLYYAPWWYSPLSVRDKEMKKYDGIGFRVVKEPVIEPPFPYSKLLPPNSFQSPPPQERIVLKDVSVICPDFRTAVVLKLEAFDVADLGDAIPYFRKQMLMLDIVRRHPGIEVDKIRDKFSKKQLEEVYPLAVPVMLSGLIDELELVGHLEIRDGKAYLTKRGEKRLKDFKASLSAEERRVLEL
jgi:uncharacterized repeat protein (TIGR04076 family)